MSVTGHLVSEVEASTRLKWPSLSDDVLSDFSFVTFVNYMRSAAPQLFHLISNLITSPERYSESSDGDNASLSAVVFILSVILKNRTQRLHT